MSDPIADRRPLPPATRKEAMRFAIASTVMEGQTVTEAMEYLLSEWAEGAMTDEELMRRAMEPELTVAQTSHRYVPGG